jgi:hypothetical protein
VGLLLALSWEFLSGLVLTNELLRCVFECCSVVMLQSTEMPRFGMYHLHASYISIVCDSPW